MDYSVRFIALLEQNSKQTVNQSNTDKAKEILVLRQKSETMPVMIKTSSTYSPESSGFIERMNRTLLDTARALIS